MMHFNMIKEINLDTLRQYHYECNVSPRGIFGERRFLGAYHSVPSGYLTVVGVRLIDGELRVYRLAREFPFHNGNEFRSLAQKIYEQYGKEIVFYDGIKFKRIR
jgi:hypothetical protein